MFHSTGNDKGDESGSSKKVVVNSVIYTFSGLLNKCFSFFLLPLYTAYLTTADYGITGIATSFISTMSFVVAFSLFSAVMRFYVELKGTPERLRRFYGTVCVFILISGLFYFSLLTILRKQLSVYVFAGVDYYPVIMVCLISLIFCCFHNVFDYIMKSQQRALKASVAAIVFFLTTVCLNLIFVVRMRMGAVGSLLATMISYILYTIYFAVEMTVKHTIHWCLDIGLLKDALKYSIPIMPHNLSTQIAMLVSKVLIGGTSALASVGIYSVASQFGNIADTIQVYVDNAYGPWLYEKLHAHSEQYKQDIRRVVRLLISVLGLFFIGIAFFSQEYIVLFTNKAYVSAWKYVPAIVMVFAIKTAYYFYVEILFYYKEASRKLFIATLAGSLVNVLLSAVIIPKYGILGSIAADGIAMIVRVSIIIYISMKYEQIGLRLRDFGINYLIIGLFVVGGLLLPLLRYPNEFNWLCFCIKIFLVLMYIVVIVLINRKQLMQLLSWLKDRRVSR